MNSFLGRIERGENEIPDPASAEYIKASKELGKLGSAGELANFFNVRSSCYVELSQGGDAEGAKGRRTEINRSGFCFQALNRYDKLLSQREPSDQDLLMAMKAASYARRIFTIHWEDEHPGKSIKGEGIKPEYSRVMNFMQPERMQMIPVTKEVEKLYANASEGLSDVSSVPELSNFFKIRALYSLLDKGSNNMNVGESIDEYVRCRDYAGILDGYASGSYNSNSLETKKLLRDALMHAEDIVAKTWEATHNGQKFVTVNPILVPLVKLTSTISVRNGLNSIPSDES